MSVWMQDEVGYLIATVSISLKKARAASQKEAALRPAAEAGRSDVQGR